MANQIRMTPDTMRTRAGEYNTEAGTIAEVISKLDALLEQLQSEWEGAAAEAYAAKFSELRPSFTEAQNLLEEISQALHRTAEIVETTDNEIAGQFAG